MFWTRVKKNGKVETENVSFLIESNAPAGVRIKVVGNGYKVKKDFGWINLISGDSILLEDDNKITSPKFKWFKRDYTDESPEEDY